MVSNCRDWIFRRNWLYHVIFVSQLAFDDSAELSLAKFSVLFASIMSGILGFIILKLFCRK